MGFSFHGKIHDREVVVMIGTAATHNFISEELVVELQIPAERTRSYRVDYGFGGSELQIPVVCNNVVLKTHGIQIIQRFFPIKLGTVEVVLGAEWLSCVIPFKMDSGPTMHSGPTMLMSFEWLGQRATLQSDPSLSKELLMCVVTLKWDDDNDGDGDDNEASCNKEGGNELCNKKEKEE